MKSTKSTKPRAAAEELRDPRRILVTGFGEALMDRKVDRAFYRRIKRLAECDRAVYRCDRESDYRGADFFGGAPVNCIAHLALLGFDACAASARADDPTGERIERSIEELGIRPLLTRYGTPETCGLHSGVVLVNAGKNSNAFFIPRHAAWDRIASSPELLALAARTDLVCFGSLAQRLRPVKGDRLPYTRETLHAFVAAMPASAWKVFDVNIRQMHHGKRTVEASIEICNALKISDGREEQFMKRYTGFAPETPSDAFCRGLMERYAHLKIIIYTQGRMGNTVYERQPSGRVKRYDYRIAPAEAERTAAERKKHGGDTVGAGDSFTAGFFAMRLRGYGVAVAQRFASKLAAFVCTRQGAVPDYRTSPRMVRLVERYFGPQQR